MPKHNPEQIILDKIVAELSLSYLKDFITCYNLKIVSITLKLLMRPQTLRSMGKVIALTDLDNLPGPVVLTMDIVNSRV